MQAELLMMLRCQSEVIFMQMCITNRDMNS